MKKYVVMLSVLTAIALTECAETDTGTSQADNSGYAYHMESSASDSESSEKSETPVSDTDHTPDTDAESPADTDSSTDTASGDMLDDVYVAFGNGHQTYAMHPYNNDTAAELIRNIGSAGINLPIYNCEGYDGADVFQYYDIPSRFEISSAPETVTEEKAGEIYYSEPNRLILFFGDAQIEGEFTRVGYIDDSEQFRSDVKNNLVVEGWGNLIIRVSLNG